MVEGSAVNDKLIETAKNRMNVRGYYNFYHVRYMCPIMIEITNAKVWMRRARVMHDTEYNCLCGEQRGRRQAGTATSDRETQPAFTAHAVGG
jgi:hypothetical protein